MKKAIFHFDKEDYKTFEAFVCDYMSSDKCKDIYEIIECLPDLNDYIQINGIVQKTCSTETPAYTIVRNIMYWYPDQVYEIQSFLYNYCDDVYEMDLTEEEVRYEAILKKLKKYTRRKNKEIDKYLERVNDRLISEYKRHISNGKISTVEQEHYKTMYDTYHKLCVKDRCDICYLKDYYNAVMNLPTFDVDDKEKFTCENEYTGENNMKTHIFESDQETFINELNDIVNEKGVLTEKSLFDIMSERSKKEREKIEKDCERLNEAFDEYRARVEENTSSPEPITDVKDVSRESLLDGAKKCVCSDRNKQYGSPEDNFGIIARYWKGYLGVDITATDVGIMMTLFKIGRMQSGGYKPDNFVDAIGYLACAGECGAKEEE